MPSPATSTAETSAAAPEVKKLAKHFRYLDILRDSGITNMYGAAPYLAHDCAIDIRRAREILSLWMKSDLRVSPLDRARAAKAGG